MSIGAIDVLSNPCDRKVCLFMNTSLKISESTCQVVSGMWLNKLRDETGQIAQIFQAVVNFTVNFIFYLSISISIDIVESSFNNLNHFAFKTLIYKS